MTSPEAEPSAARAGEAGVVLPLRLSPDRPKWIDAFGRKGSGKSVYLQTFYRSWPYDSLVIDPTGDFEATDAESISDPLPLKLALGDDREHPYKPRRYVYRPDPGSATYSDDLDRAVGLAFWTPKDRPFLLVIDEIGELTDAGKTGPNMRRTLHQHRHRALFVLCAGPRCKDLNPLVLSQADLVAFYEMPSELDQTRAAHTCGMSLARFSAANKQLAPYEYLLYTAQPDPHLIAELARLEGISEKEAKEQLRLVHCPPVPMPSEPPAKRPEPLTR